MSAKAVIELENIKKVYRNEDVETVALRGISLSIKKGEMVSIFGPSGSGKSTLLHIMGLLDEPTGGKIRIDGKDVSKLDEDTRADIRGRKIGFVFQAYNLLPSFTAVENVMLPFLAYDIDREEARRKAMELLSDLGLKERAEHRPSQLSGGQQQRVAIARALAMEPSFILADEPTGNLDSKTAEEVLAIFEDLNEEGKTLVVVTHDPNIAAYSSRVVHIKDGKIEKDGNNHKRKKVRR
ncbi:MAG: ABC transporter ATP-binding protein [Methanobacteriota archaeon]|nr:MAG: ABC transporter ATP-binding protein [Euryarchaeota archaeon]